MKILLSISAILFFSATSFAQSISPEEAKTLADRLPGSAPDTLQINILLKLAKFHVFKRGEEKNDLDSAAAFIKRAEDVNAAVKSSWADGYVLLIKSYLLKERGERDKAKETVGQAVALLKNEADGNLAGEAYMERSGYNDFNDAEALTQRIELVKSAVNCYAQSGNIQEKAASLQMLGDLYNIEGKSFLALQHLQASLDAYNSINYAQVQGIYCLMGFIHCRLREYRQALDMELLALKTAESTGDSSMQLCEIYNYLGEIQSSLKEKQKAIYYYDKAREVAKKHDDIFAIYLASVNIAGMWTALNKPAKALDLMKRLRSEYEKPDNPNTDFGLARCYINIYCALNQFEKARPYANQILANTKGWNAQASMIAYTAAIKFFIAGHETGNARKYIEKHSTLAKELNDLYSLAVNQQLRFMLDTSRHDYKAATVHLVESNRLYDSLSTEIRNRQIEELQVQYETEKKEKDILVQGQNIQLLTKQSQLQQAKIKQDRLARNATIIGAGLLLLLLIMVYSRYVLKQKSNRQLQIQQQHINRQNVSLQTLVGTQHKLIDEKEWLIKEIHHRVKNNFQVVMGLLGTQAGYQKNDVAVSAITDSQRRIQSMSLIHQKLYQSNNLSAINMPNYIHELVDSLSDSFNTSNRIRFKLEIEPIELDLAHSIPLGLILNEAITNSFKYAFPDNSAGIISISLKTDPLKQIALTIRDNGTGLPASFNIQKSDSMGMNLMRGLSEEIGAQFGIENQHGTQITVRFEYDPETTIEISQMKTGEIHSI